MNSLGHAFSYKKSASAAEKKACEAIKTNPKYFYSYAKKHSKTKTRIGPLFDESKNDYVSNNGRHSPKTIPMGLQFSKRKPKPNYS